VVTEYLAHAGLLPDLEQLGFALAGYGCTTCIGNSGDLTPQLNEAIAEHDLVCAAVLSGNRNFEARIHPNLKANFLMSPPLVVAYALAGSVLRDLTREPIGKGQGGKDVFLRDIWPSNEEVAALVRHAMEGQAFRDNYARVASDPGDLWKAIEGGSGQTYAWPHSTYIAEPPFFAGFALEAPDAKAGAAPIRGARVMAMFGDSITTDHISPAGSIADSGPAGRWLKEHGVTRIDFNSYGSRRGHHDVMMRGTFANVRIKNLMLPPKADGSREEGGTGSSRDWAAKGTQLLGIKAVVARSFERIHRSNLVGMGVLPLQFQGSDSWQSLGIRGDETIEIVPDPALRPRSEARLVIRRGDGSTTEVLLTLRIDTPIEADYYRHGGILPYVLRQLLQA
jgi:aconitate hydratase